MSNLYILEKYLSSNPMYNEFKIDGNILSYDGKRIDFTGFDIGKFLSQNSNFRNDISFLRPDDIFNILNIHVIYENAKRNIEEKQSEQIVKNVISESPDFSNLQIIKKPNNDGDIKSYLHFVDKNNKNYILENVTYKDLLIAYTYIQNSGKKITQDILFSYLAQSHSSIKLENIFEAELRNDTSQGHLNNLKELHEKDINSWDNHNQVLGNEKHGIYINNNRIITSYDDKSGKRVTQYHRSGISDSEINQDIVDSVKKESLISFEEYSSIILNNESLNPDETKKVSYFESFLSDLITYKNYLTEDLYYVYSSYCAFYEKLINLKETTRVIEQTKDRYADMEEKSKNRQFSMAEARKDVAIMSRKYSTQEKAGYMSAILYIAITIVTGIIIGVITIIAK